MHRRGIGCVFVAVCIVGLSPVRGPAVTGSEEAAAGHALNRIGYGPSPADMARIRDIGVAAFLEQQIDPVALNAQDARLAQREDELFEERQPVRDTVLVPAGAIWLYHKGSTEPPAGWQEIAYRDGDWLEGVTGIGYGDGDDLTVLEDMRQAEGVPGYVSVYLRHTFELTTDALAGMHELILRVDYDDGFKAYLNGVEIARANLPAGLVSHDRTANGSHEAGSPEEFAVPDAAGLLRKGLNVLAIQVHNRALTSSDLSMVPELLSREILPGPSRRVIRDVDALQQLMHIRGIYSRRQLQAVLAEFWENHFTTDYDKLVEHFDGLRNSDATDAMPEGQAEDEAAQVEYEEYQFFHEHALGHFGDLLLYSATSPSMLVYLDNVLNVKGKANENYAREILELHTFGVDNGYTQADIEELARCFTGWSICKVPAREAPSFPDSALSPPLECGVQFEDTVLIDLGPGWNYFKGTSEPSPAPDGDPATTWAQSEFDDSAWLRGSTGLGYGDGDDATVLSDMRNRYLSVYLRRSFNVRDPSQIGNLILEVAYDDGFVAYLNGTEVARSETMEDSGSPPAFDEDIDGGHEVDEGAEHFNLGAFAPLLKAGENVLAIQVHNTNLGSSDLSILPRLLDREILPGSIENGDRNGAWTFHFRSDQHDSGMKTLFEGTPYEVVVPSGQNGQDGLLDGVDVIHRLVAHPSTAEFICIKLIQRFVSDELTLATYEDGTAPPELLALLADAMDAWNSTDPPGDIGVLMRAILDPAGRSSAFWSEIAHRSKVKTPIEYINSSLRALDVDAGAERLVEANDDMGMELFTRDDPDGYSELASDWIDTSSMLARIEFVTELAEDDSAGSSWDIASLLGADGETPERIVARFDELLFQGTLSQATRDLLVGYLATDEDGRPKPLDPTAPEDYERRVREVVGLMLSLPQWHYQ